jgi:hypothetical protein
VTTQLQAGATLGACVGSGALSAEMVNAVTVIQPSKEVGTLMATVAPNPTTDHFRLSVRGIQNAAPIHLRIIDMNGRVMESRANLVSGSTITVGERLATGVYLIEVQQGSLQTVIKAIKR